MREGGSEFEQNLKYNVHRLYIGESQHLLLVVTKPYHNQDFDIAISGSWHG